MRFLLIIKLVLLISSCQYHKKIIHKEEKQRLIKTIDSMYQLDQGIRIYYNKLDSIYGLESNISPISRRKKRDLLGKQYSKYQKEADSLKKQMKKIDDSNTKLLLTITRKHGFPGNKRLGVYKSKAYLIFVHSPKKYFDEIRELISYEYKHNRISEYKKEFIFWHLDGRKGMPPMATPEGSSIHQN